MTTHSMFWRNPSVSFNVLCALWRESLCVNFESQFNHMRFRKHATLRRIMFFPWNKKGIVWILNVCFNSSWGIRAGGGGHPRHHHHHHYHPWGLGSKEVAGGFVWIPYHSPTMNIFLTICLLWTHKTKNTKSWIQPHNKKHTCIIYLWYPYKNICS